MASTKKQTKAAIKLPLAVTQDGIGLLDQQMWCWGCDVRRAAGNLLLAYGAQKDPSPEPRYHSAYRFPLDNGTVLTLWGWGIWAANPNYGSLFLSRARFQVRYTPVPHLRPAAWCERDLPALSAARIDAAGLLNVYRLLAQVTAWTSAYETWIETQAAPTYREQVIAAFPERRRYRGGVPAQQLASAWRQLSNVFHEEIDKHDRKAEYQPKEADVWEQSPFFA